MGKGKPNPLAPKRMEPEPAYLIEQLSPGEALWKVLCVVCKEWFRRPVRGVSEAQMWRIIQSREQVCPTCYRKRKQETEPVDPEWTKRDAGIAWARSRKAGLPPILGNDARSAQAEIIRDRVFGQAVKLPDFRDFEAKLREMLRKRTDPDFWIKYVSVEKPIRTLLKDTFAIEPRLRGNHVTG